MVSVQPVEGRQLENDATAALAIRCSAAVGRGAVDVPLSVDCQVGVDGPLPIAAAGEGVQHCLLPGTHEGLADARRRLQVEDRAFLLGATIVGCAKEGSVMADNHSGLRIAAIGTGEGVQRLEEPSTGLARQFKDGTAVVVSAGCSRAIEVSRLVHGEAGRGYAAITAAGEVVQHGPGLRLRRWCHPRQGKNDCHCQRRSCWQRTYVETPTLMLCRIRHDEISFN